MCSSRRTTSSATAAFSADRENAVPGGAGLAKAELAKTGLAKEAAGGAAFRKLRRLAGEAVAGYGMLAEGDRVLVALSGGRDSLTLLEILIRLRAAAPIHFSLEAVTFDPGFPGFNASGVGEYCRKRGVPHAVEKLDIPAVLAEHAGCGRKRRPCVLCSRLRRGRLYRYAREHHCGKLALGHHLDDVLASFLISLARGQGLSTMAPRVAADTASDAHGLVIIRPLALASEALVKAAAAEFDFPVAGRCLYHEELESSGDRAWAVRQLEEWAKRIPDVRRNMLRSLSDLRPGWLLDRRYLDLGSGTPSGERVFSQSGQKNGGVDRS